MRYCGQFTLSIDRAKSGISYKYVVLRKGEVLWEYLTEFTSQYGGIVDRFLTIPGNYLKPDGMHGFTYYLRLLRP